MPADAMTMALPAAGVTRAGSLLDRYQVPPFSVLDTRQGYWQEARRSWLALGIMSELGRGLSQVGAIPMTGLAGERNIEVRSKAANAQLGNLSSLADPKYDYAKQLSSPGTSVFDPVLTELAYRWWCPPGGTILDPFAGGSVRGIVAAWIGHTYIGVDLAADQLAANEQQATDILQADMTRPTWLHGDSRVVLPTLPPASVDFIFTCPPYYDLEVYSDDPADLSAKDDYPAFLDAYTDIIGSALACLRPGRFAAIVVSEIRDKSGSFRCLVPDTIQAFMVHGARYYNEGILVNSAGTLPLRISKQFDAGRKLGRAHQNVLVFVKGDQPRTHEWGYDRTAAPDPQLGMWDGMDAVVGGDGRPAEQGGDLL